MKSLRSAMAPLILYQSISKVTRGRLATLDNLEEFRVEIIFMINFMMVFHDE